MFRIGTIVVVLSICSFATYTEADLKDPHTEITSPPSSEQPTYLQVGERLELECTDTDGSDVQWFKAAGNKVTVSPDGLQKVYPINTDAESGFILTTNKQTKNGHLVTYSKLVKNEVQMSDSSTYECKATPIQGQSPPSHRMTVAVFEIVASVYRPKRDIDPEDDAEEAEVSGNDVALDTKGPLHLQCNVNGVTSYKPIKWYHDDQLIKPEENKYRTDARNDTLIIEHPDQTTAGAYQCRFTLSNGNNYSHTVNVKAMPSVHHFDKSKNLVQGDALTLECEVTGWPAPSISWLKRMEDETVEFPIMADHRTTFSKHRGFENASLRIEEMDYIDRAYYICSATNSMGSGNSTVLVRVKDKLAALWPFLGICAEVTILCVIIFIYEKRRAKKMEEEDAPEEAGHLTNSHDHKGNDDIRQRK